MENMTADYKSLAATQSNFLAIFKDYVDYGNKRRIPKNGPATLLWLLRNP